MLLAVNVDGGDDPVRRARLADDLSRVDACAKERLLLNPAEIRGPDVVVVDPGSRPHIPVEAEERQGQLHPVVVVVDPEVGEIRDRARQPPNPARDVPAEPGDPCGRLAVGVDDASLAVEQDVAAKRERRILDLEDDALAPCPEREPGPARRRARRASGRASSVPASSTCDQHRTAVP